jgi:hypothetical protein
VRGDGEVEDVRLGAEYVGTPFEMCVKRNVMIDATFPPFKSARQVVEFRYGFGP